jgi:hypothetical protein
MLTSSGASPLVWIPVEDVVEHPAELHTRSAAVYVAELVKPVRLKLPDAAKAPWPTRISSLLVVAFASTIDTFRIAPLRPLETFHCMTAHDDPLLTTDGVALLESAGGASSVVNNAHGLQIEKSVFAMDVRTSYSDAGCIMEDTSTAQPSSEVLQITVPLFTEPFPRR